MTVAWHKPLDYARYYQSLGDSHRALGEEPLDPEWHPQSMGSYIIGWLWGARGHLESGQPPLLAWSYQRLGAIEREMGDAPRKPADICQSGPCYRAYVLGWLWGADGET